MTASTMTNGGTVKRRRTCISCGAQGEKRTLLRIVRSPEGVVGFDATGRAAGRGAYVCSEACFEKARAAKKLERALRVSLRTEDYDQIAGELKELLQQGQREDEE